MPISKIHHDRANASDQFSTRAMATPTTESRMHPPPLPRSHMTPTTPATTTPAHAPPHDREGSAASTRSQSVGAGATSLGVRKPRQNLDENDHYLMVTHTYNHRAAYNDGTKSQFWAIVGDAFQRDTGKTLAQLSATVGRLLEARRRQLNDWERGVIATKPGGRLNEAIDLWMDFLRDQDEATEDEKMAGVEARRLADEQRKQSRRHQLALGDAGSGTDSPQGQPVSQFAAPPAQMDMLRIQTDSDMHTPLSQTRSPASGHVATLNGHAPEHDSLDRPGKRRRMNGGQMSREAHHPGQTDTPRYEYSGSHYGEPTRRVVVEGALTKEDWREIMGSDARLRALESKVDRIESMVTFNNKLLLQLVAAGPLGKDRHRDGDAPRGRGGNGEEEDEDADRENDGDVNGVPVHLDAEFERDYLSGRFAKTPLPIA